MTPTRDADAATILIAWCIVATTLLFHATALGTLAYSMIVPHCYGTKVP